MNEIPPEEMNDEAEKILQKKIYQFMENLTSSQRENIPELMASITLFFIKEYKFKKVLEMVRQSRKNFSVDANHLANWRSLVQAKLRETPKEELGLDDSQRQQLEQVLLGLDE